MANSTIYKLQDCDLNVSAFLFARLVFLWATCGLYVDVPQERAVNVGIGRGSNKDGACENGKDLILTMHNTGEEQPGMLTLQTFLGRERRVGREVG